MWVKNADPFADPHAYVSSYQHPDGEWGVIHGFATATPTPLASVNSSMLPRSSSIHGTGRDLQRAAVLVVRRSDVAHRRPGRRRGGLSQIGSSAGNRTRCGHVHPEVPLIDK